MPRTSRGVRPNYGVAIGGEVGVDMKRVKARKDAVVAPIAQRRRPLR